MIRRLAFLFLFFFLCSCQDQPTGIMIDCVSVEDTVYEVGFFNPFGCVATPSQPPAWAEPVIKTCLPECYCEPSGRTIYVLSNRSGFVIAKDGICVPFSGQPTYRNKI